MTPTFFCIFHLVGQTEIQIPSMPKGALHFLTSWSHVYAIAHCTIYKTPLYNTLYNTPDHLYDNIIQMVSLSYIVGEELYMWFSIW